MCFNPAAASFVPMGFDTAMVKQLKQQMADDGVAPDWISDLVEFDFNLQRYLQQRGDRKEIQPESALTAAMASLQVQDTEPDEERGDAGYKVAHTVELLEAILYEVPGFATLFASQRVNKAFRDTIKGSNKLQEKMWLKAPADDETNAMIVNGMLGDYAFVPTLLTNEPDLAWIADVLPLTMATDTTPLPYVRNLDIKVHSRFEIKQFNRARQYTCTSYKDTGKYILAPGGSWRGMAAVRGKVHAVDFALESKDKYWTGMGKQQSRRYQISKREHSRRPREITFGEIYDFIDSEYVVLLDAVLNEPTVKIPSEMKVKAQKIVRRYLKQKQDADQKRKEEELKMIDEMEARMEAQRAAELVAAVEKTDAKKAAVEKAAGKE